MKFRFSFLFLAFVYFVLNEGLGVTLRFYSRFASYDVLMHFLGGVGAGLLALSLYKALERKQAIQTTSMPWWGRFLFIAGVVSLVAVAWEWYEAIMDVIRPIATVNRQTSLRDTMWDLFFGILGGSTVFTRLQWKKEK